MTFIHQKHCFGFLAALTLSATALAQRRHLDFDDDWKFHFGHAADAAKDFNYSVAVIFKKTGEAAHTAVDPKLADSSWRTLNLPHDWAVELPFVNVKNGDVESHGYKPVGGLFPETSIGWYRKHFTVDRKDSGQRFQLQFDGVFRNAKFWVNGIYLGNNESGYIGTGYDITDFMNYNRDNVIAIRVDASQYEGWFYEGAGIYRHVWLNQCNNVHVANDGVFAYAAVTPNKATVTVETSVENHNPAPALTKSNLSSEFSELVTSVTDRNGKVIAKSTATIAWLKSRKSELSQTLSVPAPHLWSLEDPYLYRVVSIVKQGGKTVDSVSHRIGIRTIDITPTGVFLNNQHVKIKGTNNHQDAAGVGSAMPDYLQYYRIRLLKEMGSNAYRTSHHPPTPELLDACDSLGMLVLDEQRLLNSGSEYVNQFERMIKRDRNHPSIFLWSIGNEEGWIHTTDVGKRIAQTLLAKQKELDPSRTATYAADVGNVFRGVNEVVPVRGFNYREKFVADYHRDHPSQPIIGTEMGSTVTTRGVYEKDSIRAYVPDQDITAPWWASTAEAWWSLAAPNDFWLGGFVWTGFDYRGEPTPYAWPNISSHFGIMDACGFPKNIYYYYQSWWTDKDVLHISPHWNWKGKEGKPIEVWVNTNADNVELFLNGKSLGKKDMPRNSHLQWTVGYEPGKLEAVAYKKGRKLTAKVETTGEPYELVLTPYKTTMVADGKDATVMNISAIDKEGREVPDAANLVHFSWTGDAKIIGVGNGDPSSHEPDKAANDSAWERRLFNGKCQVILQAGKAASIIKFEAGSKSLRPASTGIHTIAPMQAITPDKTTIPLSRKNLYKMLGADISFLPQLEGRGIKFSDKGVQKDAVQILKEHGINYVRLRIFNEPGRDSGYSPKQGFCDLAHTLQMAKRAKAAGMGLLLDFHYSDTWADPEKQYKPAAWKGLPFSLLKDSLHRFTKSVLAALKAQGTLPDMVQIGNEINHGMVWPEGHVAHLDSLAQLIKEGTAAVQEVDPSVAMLLHIALGGQADESEAFICEMKKRNVPFDVIGLSYYPKWHGTLSDLQANLEALSKKYGDVVVVEYSQLKKEIAGIVFDLPGNRGKGTFIWEPLNTWEAVFDRQGKANDRLAEYDEISNQFLQPAGSTKR